MTFDGPFRVWLVQIGEELPIDPGPPRLIRTALLARELVLRGHDVTYWNAAFIHQQKKQRPGAGTSFMIDDGYRVALLEGRAYDRNISLGRILSHRENARSFRRLTAGQSPPDVMMCGLPSLEIADAATAYASAHHVPIALDCRDLWPDIIADYLPAPLRLVASPILAYWQRMLSRAAKRATAITGVSRGFVDWGVAAAGRAPSPLDQPFHLTLSGLAADRDAVRKADAYWTDLLGPPDPAVTVGVYAGSFSRRFDLTTIAAAVRALAPEQKARLRIVLCGKGDLESEVRVAAEAEPSLIVPGWKSGAELQSLMTRADFGILPYPSSKDFLVTFPNKVGEYLSFGLPIMTGLGGVIGTLLAESGLALSYITGNVGSARDLLTAISAGAVDPRPLHKGALEAFGRYFDPNRIYPEFADYLERLASEGRRRERMGRAA